MIGYHILVVFLKVSVFYVADITGLGSPAAVSANRGNAIHLFFCVKERNGVILIFFIIVATDGFFTNVFPGVVRNIVAGIHEVFKICFGSFGIYGGLCPNVRH